MARKLTKIRMEEIITATAYEDKIIKYPGIKSDVEVIINPYADFDTRTTAFVRGKNIIWNIDGIYTPGIYTFAYGITLLGCFTNIRVENFDLTYSLIHNSSIVKDVEEALPKTVLENFQKDFDDMVEFERSNMSKSQNADELCSNLIEIIKDIGKSIPMIADELKTKPVFYSDKSDKTSDENNEEAVG